MSALRCLSSSVFHTFGFLKVLEPSRQNPRNSEQTIRILGIGTAPTRCLCFSQKLLKSTTVRSSALSRAVILRKKAESELRNFDRRARSRMQPTPPASASSNVSAATGTAGDCNARTASEPMPASSMATIGEASVALLSAHTDMLSLGADAAATSETLYAPRGELPPIDSTADEGALCDCPTQMPKFVSAYFRRC